MSKFKLIDNDATESTLGPGDSCVVIRANGDCELRMPDPDEHGKVLDSGKAAILCTILLANDDLYEAATKRFFETLDEQEAKDKANRTKPLDVVFAPGALDSFNGTQEELAEMMAAFRQAAQGGIEGIEKFAEGTLRKLSPEEAEEIERLATENLNRTRQ